MASVIEAIKSTALGEAIAGTVSSMLGTSDSSSSPPAALQDPTKAGPSPPFILQMPQTSPGSEADMTPKPDFGQESYKGTGKLKDHVALITGGDSGIGRAVALAYAREGADIAISYLDEHDDAKEIQRWVQDAGRKCILLPGDLSIEANCTKLIADTVAAFGHIDILVNNHAFQGKEVKSIVDLDRSRVEHTFLTNIVSFFTLTSAALPHIPDGGCIINTGSVEAYEPEYRILDYACTKAAIVGFTKGLAGELVPKGIRVNCVAPGPVWTPLVVASFNKTSILNFWWWIWSDWPTCTAG